MAKSYKSLHPSTITYMFMILSMFKIMLICMFMYMLLYTLSLLKMIGWANL